MVKVGELPLLMHIIHHCAQAGFNDFLIPSGREGDVFGRYVRRLEAESGHRRNREPPEGVLLEEYRILDWTVNLVETGGETGAGGRIAGEVGLPLLFAPQEPSDRIKNLLVFFRWLRARFPQFKADLRYAASKVWHAEDRPRVG